MNKTKLLTSCAVIAVLQASVVQAAQLTWDIVPGTVGAGDSAITSSNGTWDASTGNWTTDGGANNIAWISGSDALFNGAAGGYTVDIADGGVTVSNLSFAPGGGPLSFKAATDGQGVTLSGSPTWDLNGQSIEFINNNNANDTALFMSPVDTLTVVSTGGGGTFDTGEKPGGANWGVSGAILDFQAANATLRGNVASAGGFDTVKLAGSSAYIHERNTDQTYANNWELGAGVVTFDNRYGRNYTLSGEVSGDGALEVKNLGGKFLHLTEPTNTFTGGVIVDSAGSAAELQVRNFDTKFGAIPASFDPDNITLRNNGELKIQAMQFHPNRGITLDNGGVILITGGLTLSTYGGTITGTGPLQIGRAAGSDGNTLVMTSNTHDYTGGTWIYQGSITLGIDNALPTNGVLSIGGLNKNGRLYMDGYDLTVGGVDTAEGGSATKEIVNDGGGIDSTLTINVASGKNYEYNSNISGSNTIHLVKTGLGTQRFGKNSYNTAPASLTVNAGGLAWNSDQGPSGLTSVNSGGTLYGTGMFTANVVLNSGARIAPGNPGGHNTLNFDTTLDLSAMIGDNAGGLEFSFGGFDDKLVATNATANGTINLDGSEFFDIGFSDFTFIDTTGIASGVYTLMLANVVSGTLDPTDLSGLVGTKGASGTLSKSATELMLTVTAGDYSPYGTWVNGYGLTGANAATNADPDADNYSNLQEYAYGGNPTNAAVLGYVPVSEIIVDGTTNWLTYAYGNRTNGISVTAETTDNLAFGTWSTNGVTLMGTGSITNASVVYILTTNGIPMDGTTDFLGAFVEQTP